MEWFLVYNTQNENGVRIILVRIGKRIDE